MSTDIKFSPIFSSFLGTGDLGVNNSEIYDWICSQSDNKHGQIRLTLDEPELDSMYDKIRKIFNNIHENIGLQSKYHQVLRRGWVNTNDDIRFNVAHCHPHSTFVSVYYPYVEGNVGELELINPNSVCQWVIRSEISEENNYVNPHKFNHFNSSRWRIVPRTGLVVFFPSWIQHYALPTTEGTRISIAMNSIIEPKEV